MGGWTGTEVNKAFTSRGGDDLPWFQLFTLELLNEVLCVFEMVWGLAYKGFNNVCKFLGNTICDGPLLETMALRGVPTLSIFGRP